jgi:ferredoxin
LVKIAVNYERCETFAMCCLSTPDLFRLNDDDQLQYTAEADESRREELLVAQTECPTRAITID